MAAPSRNKRKPSSNSPENDESHAASSHGSQDWWQSIRTFSMIVGVVAVAVGIAYLREQIVRQQYAVRIEQLQRQRDADSHNRSKKNVADLFGEKEKKLAVADFYKERLNRALMCYGQMRTFVHVLGNHAARQIEKDKTSYTLARIFKFLTTAPGENAPVLDGSADPFDYVKCYRAMEAIGHGVRKNSGKVSFEDLDSMKKDFLNFNGQVVGLEDEQEERAKETDEPDV